MRVEAHLDTLKHEIERISELITPEVLAKAVPTCPGWNLRQLISHLGNVHRYATAFLGGADHHDIKRLSESEMVNEAPDGPELIEWFFKGASVLVETLRDAPSDLQCFTFFPDASPRHFWARRQAHETLVHRIDIERALGVQSQPLDAEIAVDGISELLLGFFGRRGSNRSKTALQSRINIEATDIGASWNIEVTEEKAIVTEGLGVCDLMISAPAQELYLMLWNRCDDSQLNLVGYEDLLTFWHENFQVRWS